MKNLWLMTLPLAATLVLPAAAQQTPADTQQPSATTSQSSSSSSQAMSSDQATQSSSSDQDLKSDQNLSARQPLEPDYHQGFWGKMNPFARKKYVQKQLSPIRNRVNELDDLTAQNAKQIKDVDARAQEGIRQASAKATEADQHATDAGNKAQQANQTALQASNRLNTVEQVVGNIDQYQPATQTEIRLRPGQTTLSPKAKQALDDMTANLKDQKGYIIEVQGFSASGGQAGIQSSQAMANSVVRYLVEKNDVPVYRVFVMGLGNAKLAAPDSDNAKPAHGNRVEVSLLKNNVDQLASAQSRGLMGAGSKDSSYGPSYSSSNQTAASQQSANKTEAKSDSANVPSPQE
jgi:outer membrane protein OmpA-like peptidoglycan-associated protein